MGTRQGSALSFTSTNADGGKVAGAELLAGALQAVAQPVWVVDRDGRIRFANPAAVAVLGYSDVEELIGRDSHRTIHHHRPDGRPFPAEECQLLRQRLTGQPARSDLDWFFRRDGSMFRVSYVSAPLEMEDGRGAVMAFTDIEERLRAEEALRERETALAQERAALRRVATLVARGDSPEPVFGRVADEAEALLGSDLAAIVRFEADGTVVVKGADGGPHPVGARIALDPNYVVAAVRESGRAVRFDTDDPSDEDMPELVRALGIRSGLASPIVVDGELWGAITVASLRRALPADTTQRLADFTELMATAVASANAREGLQRLADEQAALRRVATLVAEGGAATAVFDAVAREVKGQLRPDHVAVSRYEPGAELTLLAHRGSSADQVPPGRLLDHEGDSVEATVRRTGRSARTESYEGARGLIAELARAAGVQVAVGAPIVVEGQVWGVISAGWNRDATPPADAEERMATFAELLDTAISNADSRDQLAASRARLVTEADDARRRLVRDLHDGAQQRLVHTIVTLKHAQRALRAGDEQLEALLAEALEQAQRGNAELRELAHGILPAVLTDGGLRSGVNTIISRLDLPVEVDIPAQRFSADIEASAYFVVAEALTNVVKHAHAARAEVKASVTDGVLRVHVRDDGVGGADASGRGLVGLADRVTALGGRLEVESPVSGGTLLSAALPLATG